MHLARVCIYGMCDACSLFVIVCARSMCSVHRRPLYMHVLMNATWPSVHGVLSVQWICCVDILFAYKFYKYWMVQWMAMGTFSPRLCSLRSFNMQVNGETCVYLMKRGRTRERGRKGGRKRQKERKKQRKGTGMHFTYISYISAA